MKILIIFDDTGKKSEIIEDIVGKKGFADIVVKKRRLEEYYHDCVRKLYPNEEWKKLGSIFEYADLVEKLQLISEEEVYILHCFSNFFVVDEEKVLLSFAKLKFVDEPYCALYGKQAAAVLFPSLKTYMEFCKGVISGQPSRNVAMEIKQFFEIDGLVDIGLVENFIQCIAGNFDSRYFNSLEGDDYTLVKSSSNKIKIKKEYSFYHLLPEDMKYWFVMPFCYKEDLYSASYTMERLHMTDLAIQWVHGSVGEEEFRELMDKYFYFFQCRHTRECSRVEYEEEVKSLYVDKVLNRVMELKKLKEYQRISRMLDISEAYQVDNLVK